MFLRRERRERDPQRESKEDEGIFVERDRMGEAEASK